MIRRLHGFVRRWWAGEAGLRGSVLDLLTAPLEILYRAEVARRGSRLATQSRNNAVEGLRVVSVGNLAVGGTGKTPLAAWVAQTLAENGGRPAIVARGYGRDELLLHARWNPDVPVVADPDRVLAARRARRAGADVVVLDDGFQHRRLPRDLDLVLLAAEDRFPGRLLPRGPYREPPSALERAHAVVVTRRTAEAHVAAALAERVGSTFPHLRIATLYLAPGRWSALAGDAASPPQGPVLVATTVARPGDFARQVAQALEEPVELASFPDHHEYTLRDVERLSARAGSRTLVVTEKDAVKLGAFRERLPPVRVLGQEPRWESGAPEILELLSGVVTRET